MYQGHCHCGAVHWTFATPLSSVTACNCTLCRRYGALWAYGHEGTVSTLSGETRAYVHAGAADYLSCPTCGCVMAYRDRRPRGDGEKWLVLNLRMITDPSLIEALPIDHFDGFDTFEDLPPDGRTVKDMWF